jgi:hydroxymethylpyrimidine kinase/phosphomethylpyrimidine kinase
MVQSLTIATSDSGGGAGIQADLKTFAAMGVYGVSIIVALTAQNTKEVRSIYPIDIKFIEDQMDVIFEDFDISSVKIGMLYDEKIIKVVYNNLQKYKAKNIVLDPVMISKSGAKLLQNSSINILKELLIPLAELLTPNIPEAMELTGVDIKNINEMEMAAKLICEMGSKNVLIKGGHLKKATITDLLYYNNKFYYFESQKIDTKNTHGTGCTYSSAIAANLAKNYDLPEAVRRAKEYVYNTIKYADQLNVGKGFGPLNHFYFIN